ncbi:MULTISPECIES: flagellar export chaperone FliS [Marinobacterium]|uniref:Flagellar secretion chaperone FliS n=2 Tax=Marinobacterium TaxID=48075 RepID=A0A1H6BE08_9GAMM|nr:MULTISPECIES: flagellar export chaperone FliS [Marinobacterium]TCK07052.1 flagellar protein FliS [Marinobacterium mangrovicola]SEG58545.1 flagellar protein FliS [Marinobacterium lutimaris]
MNTSPLAQYKSIDLNTAANSASPHELISMLFKGALEALAKANGAIERKDVELRVKQINKASSIIVNLKGSLDFENGGEVAANLDTLYDYMVTTLMQANRENSAEKVTEVAGLLSEVFQGWAAIPAEEHNKTSVK